MIDTLITELAKALGIGPQYIEGSLLTLALLVIVLMARTLLTQNKNESVQIGFQNKLVELTAEAIEESKKQRQAYEKNSEILVTLRDTLIEIGKSFTSSMSDLSSQTSSIKSIMETHDQGVGAIATQFSKKFTALEEEICHRVPFDLIIKDTDGSEVIKFKVEMHTNGDKAPVYVATSVVKNEEIKS